MKSFKCCSCSMSKQCFWWFIFQCIEYKFQLCIFFSVCLLHSCLHEHISGSYYLHELCMVRTASWPWDVWRRDNNMFLAGDRSSSFSRQTHSWFWVKIVCCFSLLRNVIKRWCDVMWLKEIWIFSLLACLLATYLPQVALRKKIWGWR